MTADAPFPYIALVHGTANDNNELIRTHLDDLQAEMEAGSRQLFGIARGAAQVREAIMARGANQAATAGTLMQKIADLQKSIEQQQEILKELGEAVRLALNNDSPARSAPRR